MAIAFDAVSSVGTGATNSVTLSHTCTGSDRFLVVGVVLQDPTAVGNVSGITYGGAAMTKIHERIVTTVFSGEIWGLVAPATSANDIVVSISNSTTDDIIVGGASFTGVNQSSPTEAPIGTDGFDAAPQLTVTSLTDNAWIIDLLYTYLNPTSAESARWEVFANSSSYGACSTFGPKTPAGAVAMDYSLTGDADWLMVGCGIKPAAEAATSGIRRRMTMGIGQ